MKKQKNKYIYIIIGIAIVIVALIYFNENSLNFSNVKTASDLKTEFSNKGYTCLNGGQYVGCGGENKDIIIMYEIRDVIHLASNNVTFSIIK